MSYGETLRKLGVTEAEFNEAVSMATQMLSDTAEAGKVQPFKWIGARVTSDQEWDFLNLLNRGEKIGNVADLLETQVFR